jgi:hypothetical protein
MVIPEPMEPGQSVDPSLQEQIAEARPPEPVAAPEPPDPEAPKALPKTAGNLPFTGLAGLYFVLASVWVGACRN